MMAALGFGGEMHVMLGHSGPFQEVSDGYTAMLAAAPEFKP